MSLQSRREFTKLALAALPAAGLLSSIRTLGAAERPAKAKTGATGVHVGLNVPYSFGNPSMSGDEVLQNCVKLGLDAVELRTQPVEAFLGAPVNLLNAKAAVAVGGAALSNAEQLRQWRRTAPMARLAEFRQKYETAGILIEIVKVDGIFKMSEAELDYVFTLGKALGARALSTEISKEADEAKNDANHKRVGQFADQHKLMIGYHGHATTTPEHWERAFALAKYNAANVDLGHFVAGNNTSPVPFIKKYHERIPHVHVKDRKMNNGINVPFGEGDTPIAEVLRLIRDNRWNIQATIEFEYKVPAGSDRMTELARTVKFCRQALA